MATHPRLKVWKNSCFSKFLIFKFENTIISRPNGYNFPLSSINRNYHINIHPITRISKKNIPFAHLPISTAQGKKKQITIGNKNTVYKKNKKGARENSHSHKLHTDALIFFGFSKTKHVHCYFPPFLSFSS